MAAGRWSGTYGAMATTLDDDGCAGSWQRWACRRSTSGRARAIHTRNTGSIPICCASWRFLYLVAIMDWATRKVLAWRLSNTMDTGFCVAALEEALARFGRPEIFNTDQGSQFTSFAFTSVLRDAEVRISMDGRGRWMDNVFIERLWRSLKYECVYLHAFETVQKGGTTSPLCRRCHAHDPQTGAISVSFETDSKRRN